MLSLRLLLMSRSFPSPEHVMLFGMPTGLLELPPELFGISPAPEGCPHIPHKRWIVENVYYEGRIIHGKKYDYRLVKSLPDGSATKIPVWCWKCNKIFTILLDAHLTGDKRGCQRCSDRERWTVEKIKEKGAQFHPTCDYSDVLPEHITDGARSEIVVFCKRCQKKFPTTISGHFNGIKSGCPKCVDLERWTVERVKEDGPKIHPTCDYLGITSDHITHGCDSKIPVFCTICQRIFIAVIRHHLTDNKGGCMRCANMERWTVEKIKEMGEKFHPTCDYSDVLPEHITDGARSEIPVFCKLCQIKFPISIRNHFGGIKSECPKCSNREQWSYERVMDEGPKSHPTCDYSAVRPEHISHGCRSRIPVCCKLCRNYFWPTIHAHLTANKTGCPPCNKWGCSKAQIEWLEYMMKKDNTHIQHAKNGGEYRIPGTRYPVDGYSPQLNKIYEFDGDFWHGNPDVYDRHFVNDVNGKTMGELHDKTMEKRKIIHDLRYNFEFTGKETGMNSRSRNPT